MVRSSVPRVQLPEEAQAAGFVVGGEPLAVDLADTIVTVTEPPSDLLADEEACERFWAVQATRLPDGWATPPLAATRRLRNAIRSLLDSSHSGQPHDPEALAILNRVSQAASTTVQVASGGRGLQMVERWSARKPSDLALGAAARSAIRVLTDPAELARLRRCANPNCSMLFVNGDARRQWCTPNICGNRARVARHYRRHRTAEGT